MYTVEINGISLTLKTVPEMFSPSGADAGTLNMLSKVSFSPDDVVLDLGCGCGIVGILAAKLIGADRVTMSDVSETAVEIARKNAVQNGVPDVKVVQSDAYESIDGEYTLIISNPPYHADFAVPKRFIEGGFRRLKTGGRMVMVTKRLEWYKNKLMSVFGGVKVIESDGYYIFIAEKRGNIEPKKNGKPVDGLSGKLRRKYSYR